MLSDRKSELYEQYNNHSFLKHIEKLVDEAHKEGFIGALMTDIIRHDGDFKSIGILAESGLLNINDMHLTSYNWLDEHEL